MGSKSEKINQRKVKLKSVDFFLLVVTLVLVAFGLTMVFSASYYSSISETDSPFYYLIKDGMWVIIGLVCMFAGMSIDYKLYSNDLAIKLIGAGCLILLVLVLTPVGSVINGASRWIAIGPITIMPGEIAKAGMIMFVAWFFGKKPNRIKSISMGILPVLLVMLLVAFLIVKQPNLSTAITLCGITVAMLIVAGMKWIYVFGVGGAGVAAILGLIMTSPGYWGERFTGFLDPFSDTSDGTYQVVQSLLALGSGGLFGAGLGKSVQKSLYLPEPQNDFILAIIGEELGFIGIIVLMIVYCLFIWRGMRIALNAPDHHGMLLASGIVLMVGIQVILNVAVVTSSMPATGINLPFVSYGGNALMIFMYLTGVLLNISRHEKELQ